VHFYACGFACERVPGLDDVGIEGTLGQDGGIVERGGGFLEDVYEGVPDDASFFFRVRDTFEIVEEQIGGIDNVEVYLEVVEESSLD
jgi:hypothetical protein